MPFAKVDPQADFPALEREVLQFWADRGIFQKRRDMNIGKPTWSFLDGPITANNPMGVHHAWGRTYKDVFNRYFAMTGHELRYQNGFDCQGLWVEVEVEKELGLKSKRDIENLVPGDREASVAKFVQLCKDRVDKFARVQTEQSVRLGMWMDWDRTDADWAKPVDERKSYFTMSNENNYTIWSFLKKCHGKGLIYRGYDAMPWCGRCGVGLSEQEMKEGYKLVEHKAAFVRFPLRNRPNENLLVWTTTPWTLTSNVGAAINPELVYLKVQLKGETFYVSKGAFKLDRMAGGGGGEGDEGGEEGAAKKGKKAWLDGVPHLKSIEQMFKEKAGKDGFTIAGEVKGEELLGWEYDGPFDDLPAQQAESGYPAEVARVVRAQNWAPAKPACQCHRVVSGGKDVTDTEGTGIVHTAPGCGGIDFTWGKENGLPPVAPLGEDGNFLDGFGPLAGKNAADSATADAVFEELKKKNLLFAVERYVHRYPHCWRCKTELLYRLVDEWFIGMGKRNTEEGFRGDIMKVVKQVTFLPESLNGRAREYDWLWNMGDWMISKKRFWGLALPIWVDEKTGDFEVIGSYAELKERAVEGWREFDGHSPHRPFVDQVKIKNPKTGNLMSRVPDVGNPWLDAGIVAFSTMKYNRDRAYWRKWCPADFITESFPGQFRNWFYALLALSTMMSDGEPPFKTLLGFATVTDQFGKPMHKSDGNAIEFNSAAGDENNGYELFFDTELKKDAKVALDEAVKKKDMPDGYIAYRDAPVTLKDGSPGKRVYAKYKPISTDVIRWQYCRANPALNVKFGPEPADEVRSKFIFKLWNSYSFFCNCAAGDGFDPTKPAHQVPVSERPDLDRWVLSCLHELTTTANEKLRQYDTMNFALAAEKFVDDDLSNWYVRRVKPRLNSKVADLDEAGLKDKWAAYQTLHRVLTVLCRLLAPCIPFITEVMWKNLRSENDPESVHLHHYPQGQAHVHDAALVSQMDTLREVITLGGAARNVAKINVRQPLAELAVRVLSDEEVATVKRFDQLIRDELNVKAVIVYGPGSNLLTATAKFNAKTANAKLGAKRKDAEAELAKRDARELARQLRAGPVEFAGVPLEVTDVLIEFAADQTGYAGTADNRGREGVVATTITEELKLEGLARNVVRQVNIARKDAALNIADSITLHLHTTAEPLAKAIAAHRETIAAESQATAWSDTEPAAGHRSETKIDGHPLVIAFKKV